MILQNLRYVFLLSIASCTTNAVAQNDQVSLEARYDRAIAAGYKALFLCSAIANAEAFGVLRTPESVHEWELTGTPPFIDHIIRSLPYQIVRPDNREIGHVQVRWSDNMPDRIAVYKGRDAGCSILPIGAPIEGNQWRTSASEVSIGSSDQSIDSDIKTPNDKLRVVFDKAFGENFGLGSRTSAILVMKDGRVIGESYAEGFHPNTPQRTWSVAKSIASTLVGAATLSREHSVSDPINITYWRRGGVFDLRQDITIDHALRMASGRYSDTPGNRTDPLYWGGSTVDETVLHWPQIHRPGEVFRYANNDTLLAIKAVKPWLDFYPADEFFAKLGMTHTVAETDWNGDYVLSSQAWTTARDLAKLGQLYLQNGIWDGHRVLPEGWRYYVSQPSGPQPRGTSWGYGAGWWTFRRPTGNAFDGVPDDAIAARGNRGQYLVIVPSQNLVLVRRGEDMFGKSFDIAAFTKAILEAIH